MLKYFFAFFLACNMATACAEGVCPSTHLEPALDNWGRAFGNPVKVTSEADLGYLHEDEDIVFQYFEYLTPVEAGFSRVWAIHLIGAEKGRPARLVLMRMNMQEQPVKAEVSVDYAVLLKILALAEPVVNATRYPEKKCDVEITHGGTIQVASMGRDGWLRGGQAYAPIRELGQVVRMGCALKKHVLGQGSIQDFFDQLPASQK